MKILAGVMFVAALCAATWLSLDQQADTAWPAAVASQHSGSSESRFSSLPAREPIGRQRGSLFDANSPALRAAVPQKNGAPQSTTPTLPPSAPPMPYRVAGKVVRDGVVKVLLARGDELFSASEGETVEKQYRVESIGSEKVTLVYLPLDLKQVLPVVSALAPKEAQASTAAAQVQAPRAQIQEPPAASRGASASAEPAELRWQGPERVRTGERFEVALKVTSSQALRAAPLQITFDASVLEAVEVRAGRIFDGGKFNYRINPSGSIFVGAAGKGVPAEDAELFVASFKTIRPAAAAELRVSALMLQSASGQAILHQRPAAFRTTIVER